MKRLALGFLFLVCSNLCFAETATPDFGFENIAETGGLAAWRSNSSQPLETVEVVEGTQFVRSGQHAAKLVQNNTERPGHLHTNASVPVKAGEKYIAGFWVKGNGRARAMAYLYNMNDAGQESFNSSVGLPPLEGTPSDAVVPDDGQWHHHQYTLQFDNAQAKTARLVIEASGTVYVDDAQLASAAAVAAAESKAAAEEPAVRPNLITLGLSPSSPKVDGIVGDGEYAIQGGGMLNNATQDLYRLPNAFYLSRDNERLYFALSLRLPDGYKLTQHPTDRDADSLIATRDVLYLFVRPDNNAASKLVEGAYLAVSSNGAIYDAWESVDWQNAWLERDAKSFNAGWDVKTNVENGTWTTELSVPIKDLKLAAVGDDAGGMISFGVNLQDAAITWQLHPNWFDHYQAFGRLRFADDGGVIAAMPSAGTLARGQLAPSFQLTNTGDGQQPYELTYLVSTPRMVGGGIGSYVFDQIVDKQNKDVVRDQSVFQWGPSGTLKPGEQTTQATEAKLDETGYYVLEMEARAGGKAVAYQKIPFRYYPPIIGQLTPVPSKELIKANISLAGAAAEERGKVRVTFKDKSGKAMLAEERSADADEINADISMANLPPGEYDVDFVLTTVAGAEVATSTIPFKKWETPIWLTERAGIDALEPDWVPHPWTKIEQTDDHVSVWGRDFVFKPDSLLADITSQEKSLLASGAVIKYAAEGKEHALSISKPEFESVNDGRAVLTQAGDSPHFSLTVRQTIEFDGMNRIDLTITPKQGNVSVEKLWLDLPFKGDMPFTALTSADGRFWQHGIAPDSFFDTPRGYRWLWIGNDNVGCGFFADNYKGWIINSKKPRLALRSGSGSRTLALMFVNEPSEVSAPMEITIGLQPSPFKPVFDGWRDIRPQGLGMTPPPTNLVMPHASLWNSADNKPSPRNWKLLEDMLAYLHGRGQRVYPYMGAFFISPYDNVSREFPFDPTQGKIPEEFLLKKKETATRQEEYFYFAEDWLGTPRYIVESPWETRQEARTSPSSSWTDFFVHGIAEMLKRSKLDGVYLDIQQPMTSYSEEKGHVHVTKDGVREGTAELFATRDFYKRMYRVFEQNRTKDQHPWMLGHGFAANMPFGSFWDVNFNGEEIKLTEPFQATPMNLQDNVTGNPMVVMTDPAAELTYSGVGFRSVFGGQFGVPTMYLPQYGYLPELNTPEHSREILSITFVHNNLLWPAYIPPEPIYEFWSKVEVPFGMGDTEFSGYWENGIETSDEFVKASYWKKIGRDEYLLAIANWSGKPVNATVKLPQTWLSLQQRVEMESGSELSADPVLKIPVPAHDVKVVHFK